MSQEEARLTADRELRTYWKRWGPYLSERQWGTVREDYSSNGTAWEYFPHDPMIILALVLTVGVKMALQAFLIPINGYVLRSRFGMGKIQFSKSGCLG